MNITHGLRRVVQVNPDGLATVFGTRRRTWRETGERVARLAAGFRALGVNAGDRIAILSLNSDRYLEVYLATGWAGRRRGPAQHPLEPARKRGCDARLPGQGAAGRQGVRADRGRIGDED